MSIYGPRPGERVCKVNFSKLTDQEKKNTNLLLAKQQHEIVFEEEGDHFVANIKFIKSPARDSPSRHLARLGANSTRSPGRCNSPRRLAGSTDGRRDGSGSPDRNKKQSTRPTRPPVPTTKASSRSRDREPSSLFA